MLPLKIHFPRWLTTAEVEVLTSLSHLKVVWKKWDLRTFILVSLGLQVLLILVGPFRKKTGNVLVTVPIWVAYLLADYVAIQAIGLIPDYSIKFASDTHPDILAFWAPFLLVHLGGPDPITALSLEDNELWLRTALHLFTYIYATGRVFFQSLPTNILSIPTIFMFFAGFLKYLERTLSLYYARLTEFKSSLMPDPEPGPDYASLMSSSDPNRMSADQPTHSNFNALSSGELRIDIKSEEMDEMEEMKLMRNVKLVRDAFRFFDKYKGLYVDLTFSLHDWKMSRAYFLRPSLTAKEAFTVLEMELNFTYEVFFTKMVVIHRILGSSIRFISCFLQASSLLIWVLFIDKKQFLLLDCWITYTLLVGAMLIEFIAFLMVLLSDWKLAMLTRESEKRASFYEWLLSARSYRGPNESSIGRKIKRVFFRRWSDSISQFSVIDYCADPWSKRCFKLIFKVLPPIKDKCDGLMYVSNKWFPNDLRDFIFDELKQKAEFAEHPKDAEEICNSKGYWIIRLLAGFDFDPSLLSEWTLDVEYDECVLIWHIATEILFNDHELGNKSNYMPKETQYCKTLSDYMAYLLIRLPSMMLSVAGISDVRFRDTYAEATIFFENMRHAPQNGETEKSKVTTACKQLMDVNTHTRPRDVKGGRSKSVLFDGVRLAKELKKVGYYSKTVKMWELMAKVWVELLCYSATHTRASTHAAQLKQGGELITLVWLLMVHLGLATQHFRIN